MTLSELDLPVRTEDEVRSFIGQGPRHLIARSLSSDDASLIDRALKLYDEKYALTYMHAHLYSGILESLSELSKHYKIAVLSNKQDAYVKALVAQLLPSGICITSRGTLDGIPAKPNPSVALDLAAELGERPNECILIGDSEIDVLTAKNASFEILSVSWGYASRKTLYQHGAIDVIDAPIELLEYFN